MDKEIIVDCPFCEGEIDGCCFCDHTGKVKVGENYFFNTISEYEDASKVEVNNQNK